MINYLKSVIFNCQHPKFEANDSKVRYWHIVKRKCFPQGCAISEGAPITPVLTVSQEEYRAFLDGFKVFQKWAHTRSKKLKTNFIGVIQRVIPRFEIALVESTLFHTFEGYALLYKECLIDNTFFEDYVYVLIDKETQDIMNFHDDDTVSGAGRFNIDERGIVTISSPAKLKTIIPGSSNNYWDVKALSQVSLRYVNYLQQDNCLRCQWALINTEWYPHRKRHRFQLCCPLKECVLPANGN